MTLRERLMVFLTCFVVVYVFWNELLYRPVDETRRRLVGQLESLEQDVLRLDQQVEVLAPARASDPNAGQRQRLNSLRGQLRILGTQLEQLTHNLIPPERMASMLEALITGQARLELVRLEGLGVKPALDSESDSPPGRVPMLFKHGLRIDFSGGYLETLNYLRAVEELPWRVLWDKVTYSVEQYPRATVSITVYSLSLDEAWIGV